MFDSFARELHKYNQRVHRLYPPASLASINEAERELGSSFPEDYKAFLQVWNGGLLFAKEFYDTLIWYVADPQVEEVKEYESDVGQTNRELVSEQGHPQHLLGIASHSDGNLICLDMTRAGRPVLWLREEECIEEEWDTLAQWLDDEMDVGASLYDRHGNDLE